MDISIDSSSPSDENNCDVNFVIRTHPRPKKYVKMEGNIRSVEEIRKCLTINSLFCILIKKINEYF